LRQSAPIGPAIHPSPRSPRTSSTRIHLSPAFCTSWRVRAYKGRIAPLLAESVGRPAASAWSAAGHRQDWCDVGTLRIPMSSRHGAGPRVPGRSHCTPDDLLHSTRHLQAAHVTARAEFAEPSAQTTDERVSGEWGERWCLTIRLGFRSSGRRGRSRPPTAPLHR
jgi:hypothetical protein